MLDDRLSLFHKTRTPAFTRSRSAPLLILLHGYGSDCRDLMNLSPTIDPRFLVVSPQGPIPLKSGGYGWFRMNWTAFGPAMFAWEAEAARHSLISFIDEVKDAYPVDPDQVYLLGFNQGAILSLSVALTEPAKVAGTIAVSGCILPDIVELARKQAPLNGLPVMVLHGAKDTLFPVKHARHTRDCLSDLPLMLTYKEYEAAHEITDDMALDVADWLQLRLNSRQISFANSI